MKKAFRQWWMAREFWDEWRGHYDGTVAMLIKRLVSVRGWRIDLHKMVNPDMVGCFHAHPSHSWRVILWGGYVEEVAETGREIEWRPMRAGFVHPTFGHRIAKLINKRSSYSLWISAPKCAEVQLIGPGWRKGADG
jgi:hypothetical protein